MMPVTPKLKRRPVRRRPKMTAELKAKCEAWRQTEHNRDMFEAFLRTAFDAGSPQDAQDVRVAKAIEAADAMVEATNNRYPFSVYPAAQ